jgi:hypothetical protein
MATPSYGTTSYVANVLTSSNRIVFSMRSRFFGPPPFLGQGRTAGWGLFFVVAVGIVAWRERLSADTGVAARARTISGPTRSCGSVMLKARFSRDEYLRIASDLDTHEQPRGA